MGKTVIKNSFDRFIFNKVTYGATVPPGMNSQSFTYNNPYPDTTIDGVIVLLTPNNNWIRAYADIPSTGTLRAIYYNEFNGNITGNWEFLVVHRYD